MGLTSPPLEQWKKTAELELEGHPLRRGVRSDVQLSCTETRFKQAQKLVQVDALEILCNTL